MNDKDPPTLDPKLPKVNRPPLPKPVEPETGEVIVPIGREESDAKRLVIEKYTPTRPADEPS